MLTVTQLARACGSSRTSVLYYERVGLLEPASRSANGYRWYGEREVARLKAIIAYRSYGVPIDQIGTLLDHTGAQSQSQILRDHFDQLEREIQQLRDQQKAMVSLLQEPELIRDNAVTKERWVAIMRAAGFDDAEMTIWHQKFEQMEPEEHQRFLESLGIGPEEIRRIRNL